MPPAASFPRWHAHADVWVLIGLVALAWLAAVRSEKARRGGVVGGGVDVGGAEPGPVVTPAQAWSFAGAIVTLLVASDWPVHDVAEGYLYSVHMLQHLLITLVAAMLLVLGTPAWMARRILGTGWRLRMVRSVTRLVPALAIFNLVLVLSHWPAVVEATVRFHGLHFLAHLVLISSAIVLWTPLFSPLAEVPRLRPPVQIIYLFLQTIVPTVPASFLTFGTHPLYRVYARFPRLWGISAVTDQQMAGLLMKLGGGLFLWGVILVVFFRWFSREEAADSGVDYDGRLPDSLGGGDGGMTGGDGVLLWEDVERELNRTP